MSSDPTSGVRGTIFAASDTRETYRQKIARITLDSMVQFVGLLDARGTVLEINQVALDAVGITLSDVEGRPFWETFWWQVSPEVNATLRGAIQRAAEGEFVRWDAEIFGRSGGRETIIIDASLMPVKDEAGKVVFIAAEGRDITEKIAYERAIARQREELARLDELKTNFFANISHEFRTPLTLMRGPIEDALADEAAGLSESQRARLEMIQRNALRLEKLVNTLLDFSRVQAGRMQAMYQPTDLVSLTYDLVSNFRSACEKAGLLLTIDAAPLPEPVYVDREMWEKIILNLVSNAFKFTFDGGITVSVRSRGSEVVVRVADTGIGIPEKEVPLIFDRFQRVEGARGRTHEGTGIGLALVKELVQLHKGTVSVESEAGHGSVFTVRLPFGFAHLPAEHIAEPGHSIPSEAAAAFVGEAVRWLPEESFAFGTTNEGERPRAKILFADDNADMRHYVGRMLASRHDVLTAADGEEAFALLERARPDIVLADIMMPKLDGFGLLQRVRAHPTLRATPVILLSARAGEEAKVEGFARGADDYLVKPFSARELFSRLDVHLNMTRLRREATEALKYRTAQFETLFNQAPIGVFLVDTDLRMHEVNPVARRTFGEITGSVEGKNFDEIMHSIWAKEFADQVVEIFRQVLETGKSFVASEQSEVRADRGVTEHYEWRVDRIVLPDGQFGAVCYFNDIAERVQAEATRQLLINELNHRVKNTLSTVQAIAQQTLRHVQRPTEFAGQFFGRLQSLGRIHALLTEAKWQGADLRELILDQILQGPVDETRVAASGPSTRVGHQTALALALMLHELGTNAIKHGALSTGKGNVVISWWVKNDMLFLRWSEQGGRSVSAPTRRGFGTTLIEQTARNENGSAEALYEAEGVTWDIALTTVPPVGEELPAVKPMTPVARGAGADVLKQLRLLVIEDEAMIAIDMEQRLLAAGAIEARIAGSEGEALLLIENASFDAALLDARLHGKPVDAIAAALTRRNIPFVFVTGYSREGLPNSFRNAIVLDKPFSDTQLFEALASLTKREGNVVPLKG